MSVNKVILVGNLGKDPEVRYLDGGVAVATFSIATSESYKDRNTGERVKQTEWHNIVMWRGLAEIAEKYLNKGNQVYIEGKLRTRSWDDQAGNKRYTTEIVADNMTMLGSRSDQSQSSVPPPTEAPKEKAYAASTSETKQETALNQSSSEAEVDDLPF